MNEKPLKAAPNGRVNTVLVFKSGAKASAIVSTVVAQASTHGRQTRIRFSGPVVFDEKTTDHLRDVVWGSANAILNALGIPQKNYEISIVNLEAAASLDLNCTVGGYSADVAVFLAIMSAGLQVTIPKDMVCTGHIASMDGDIRIVKEMSAKIEAASKDRRIRSFIYPRLDQDLSFETLTPKQRNRIYGAIAEAKSGLDLIPVRNVAELIRAVITEDQIIKSALDNDFYLCRLSDTSPDSPLSSTIGYLVNNNEVRFWKVLERQLDGGSVRRGRLVTRSLCRFSHSPRKYIRKNWVTDCTDFFVACRREFYEKRLSLSTHLLLWPSPFSSANLPKKLTTKMSSISLMRIPEEQ